MDKVKQKDFDMAVRLFPQAAEIELEYVLASLKWPDYSISYDENGHYWKMNDTRIPMPNFKGYVPKWLRDNDAAFELMIEDHCHPFQFNSRSYKSYRAVRTINRADVSEVEAIFEDDSTETRMKAARLAILKGAIYKHKAEKQREECVLRSL